MFAELTLSTMPDDGRPEKILQISTTEDGGIAISLMKINGLQPNNLEIIGKSETRQLHDFLTFVLSNNVPSDGMG